MNTITPEKITQENSNQIDLTKIGGWPLVFALYWKSTAPHVYDAPSKKHDLPVYQDPGPRQQGEYLVELVGTEEEYQKIDHIGLMIKAERNNRKFHEEFRAENEKDLELKVRNLENTKYHDVIERKYVSKYNVMSKLKNKSK